ATRLPLVPLLSSDPATSVIFSLSLHDALPICGLRAGSGPTAPTDRGRWSRLLHLAEGLFEQPGDLGLGCCERPVGGLQSSPRGADRKSTRLNSSHVKISYAVFCLKKKKTYVSL